MPQTCFLAKAEVPVELFRFHPASRSNTAEATVLEEIEDSSTSALVILIVCPARKRSRNGGTSCNNVFSRTGLARTRSPRSTYTSYLSIANFFSISKDPSKRVIIFARKHSFFRRRYEASLRILCQTTSSSRTYSSAKVSTKAAHTEG